ncbi:hypothetical protein GCM10010358_41370 [Streptomyces minutiscleroticus]|uniref:C2H2-type domain-containing protein n=1 Tax=Streptomyces minutiscleroticus TaxID=68238 RepID=A0A918U209_9ACTN|nr:hypothetical protein [Streptomyces minutiscleroticus]GGX82895.1 hypothetical protein GCM10010358_41370 [Streptomyces minutiscleroticus]
MSESTGQHTGQQTGRRGTAAAVVHESYSFACMRCGHGWEQSYAIEHHLDADGVEVVTYVADGRAVPSPLTRPSCANCDGSLVRIMRAGQVSSALDHLHRAYSAAGKPAAEGRPAGPPPAAGGPALQEAAAPEPAAEEPAAALAPTGGRRHPWHLADLLHPFQHRRAG